MYMQMVMTMNEQPLVSVLMTAFNREKYIAEAIESVLCSTYTNFELIIVDDCSVDNTVAIAKKYGEEDQRVKVYTNEKNLGDYYNRNKAAFYAKGTYIKYLDSDDTIYPWGLEAMLYCMEKFPAAGFGLMLQNMSTKTALPIALQPADAYRKFYFGGHLINMGPTGAIIKKVAFESVGGFSGKRFVGDTELWYKLASQWPLVCMPNDLIWWREHDSQQIKDEQKNTFIKFLRYSISLDALLKNKCPLPIIEREMALKNLKNLYCRNIIRLYFKGQFKKVYQLTTLPKMTMLDLIRSLKRNKYPALN